MASEQPSLVVDSGSGTCKAGFAGDHTPKIVFSSKVGRPRSRHCVADQQDPSLDLKDWYAGDEADMNRGVLAINCPVEKGIVTNWDNIEKLWQHTFNKLGVSSEDRPILLTDTPNNPEANREKMAEIMFETFNSPAIFIAIQGVLSLYSYGLVTGIAVDTGAEVTQIVPTIEGNLIPEATSCLDLGGRDLNNYLMKILIENGISFTYQHPIADVCKMKEKLCYVASDFKKAMHFAQRSDRRTYILPDNQVISMASERFQCPEALFQPSFLGKEFNGVHRTCYDSIAKCDDSVRKDLLSNIVLSGGSSLFPGFAGRMADELTALVRPANARAVNVMAVPSRRHNVWIGGSIVAAQSAFQDMWLKKQEYEECGPSIIHKKCV